MTPTDYRRQVPIQHRLSVVIVMDQEDYLEAKNIITGYKVQRAWYSSDNTIAYKSRLYLAAEKLARGEEVEGFEWIDIPIVEGV